MQECVLKEDSTCVCSCLKPKLLHKPCSHVIAACGECGIPAAIYASPYYRKESIAQTQQYEINGYRMINSFTEPVQQMLYIPDPATARLKRGRRPSRHIRNDMNESEIEPRGKQCSACNELGHTYKKCRNKDDGPSGSQVEPLGDDIDGTRPPGVPTTRACRRSRFSRLTIMYQYYVFVYLFVRLRFVTYMFVELLWIAVVYL